MIPDMWHSRKHKTKKTVKTIGDCQRFREEDWKDGAQTFLGHWYYNAGYMTWCICPNPSDLQYSE